MTNSHNTTKSSRRRYNASQRLRRQLEEAIERAVRALDTMDGDPDFEPSLGVEQMIDQRRWAQRVGLGDDREFACEDEGSDTDTELDQSDYEPEGGGWSTLGAQWQVRDPLTIPDSACEDRPGAVLEQAQARYQQGRSYSDATAGDDVVALDGGKVRVA